MVIDKEMNIMKEDIEEWRPVKDYEARYLVSNHGRVLSINVKGRKERLLDPAKDGSGYYLTRLRMKPLYRDVRIHQLVAETFLVKPDIEHPCVNHIDGNKTNNNISNLEWVSKRENCIHAVKTGLHDLKGSKHPNSKMTETSVRALRAVHEIGFFNNKQIGAMFGITREQARDIISRKNWNHI